MDSIALLSVGVPAHDIDLVTYIGRRSLNVFETYTDPWSVLSRIRYNCHRGNEFKNQLIEETLETFAITRSLSHKGYSYDNAVA